MEEIRDVVLEYVRNEYMEDQDEELTYDTALISGGFVDSFSMVSKTLSGNQIQDITARQPGNSRSLRYREQNHRSGAGIP